MITYKYIHFLNDNINDKSFEECLKIIDINDINSFKEKIKKSVKSFKNLLDDIYLNAGIKEKKLT